MKVLLYTEDFPAGQVRTVRHSGIARYNYDLACALSAAGRSVTVLTGREGLPGEPYTVQALPRFNGRLAGRALRVRGALAGGAGHLVLAGDPLAHRVLALGGAPGRVPCVPVFYGTELRALAPTIRYAGLSPVRRLQRATWRSYLARSRARIVISRYTAGALDDALGRPVRSVIVYPAAPPEALERAPQPAAQDAGPLRVLVIGRISERKNQVAMVRMLAALRARERIDVRCTLVGNVDDAKHAPYAQALRDVVEGARAGDWVTIVPEATDDEKLAHIDACDVVVALSRTVGAGVEGFGITAIEAGARGRPAIVSTEGGMPETIVKGETGFAVGVDDEAAFGRAIADLARDPALRARMGAAARAHVARMFTRAEMARRFEEGLA